MNEGGIGARLRTLRMRQGLTGKALAQSAGVSASLVSRIERGNTLPSVGVLVRLAKALGSSLVDLVDESPAPVVPADARVHAPESNLDSMVVKKDERFRLIHPISKAVYELLTPSLNGRHEVLQLVLGPGREHTSRMGAHPEGQETVVVLKGRCTIRIGSLSAELDEGDAVTFDATIPHRYINTGVDDTALLAIVTPPHVGI
ncbi:MAG: XRE family transcriptional regulator [Anaerolineae bacterium]